MFSKIKLCIFIISGMFASAEVNNIMDCLSFALNISPLHATTSLEKLGYQCKVNQNILYGFCAVKIASIIYRSCNAVDYLYNYPNKPLAEKRPIVIFIIILCIEFIELVVSLFNFNWTYIIIANVIMFSTKMLLMILAKKSMKVKDMKDMKVFDYTAKLLIICILLYWNFSEIAKILCISPYITICFISSYDPKNISPITYFARAGVVLFIVYITCKDVMLIFYLYHILIEFLINLKDLKTAWETAWELKKALEALEIEAQKLQAKADLNPKNQKR